MPEDSMRHNPWTTPPAEPVGSGVQTLCVECGPDVSVDEDGCCMTCGATATGTWLRTAPASHAVGSGVQGLVDELERKAAEWVRVAAKDSNGMITLTFPKEDAALLLRAADALRTAPAETREPDAELLDALERAVRWVGPSRGDENHVSFHAEALLRKHGRLPHTPEAT